MTSGKTVLSMQGVQWAVRTGNYLSLRGDLELKEIVDLSCARTFELPADFEVKKSRVLLHTIVVTTAPRPAYIKWDQVPHRELTNDANFVYPEK